MPRSPSFHRVNPREALVALGANLPNDGQPPEKTLLRALAALDRAPQMMLHRASRFFVSAAFPPGSGPDYVNSAAVFGTTLEPWALLERLHAVEAVLGRQRAGRARWSARVIDLDLLAAGDAVLPDAATQDRWRALPPEAQGREAPDGLILPHPRMQDRAFVLAPLAEVAPGWRHPRTGQTVAAMLAALPAAARAEVRPLAGSTLTTAHFP